ncbi:PREDICTED: centromere-associated protein E [Chrysochloris asiatica]|uniref:Centromere-associated protein E n=1 Tax=Chrysochloris asiatica TaxID=185453 RepID=A0A9B0TZ54_CHRAS|nr:PREDICTED: centromere-associated protein E [Chrysochloris asiatica]
MVDEGAVAVCVRVRPLNSREEALGDDTQVYWKTDKNTVYQVDGSKSFNFDRVFHSNETTKNVYEEIAVPIIESAIQGYNGTIFAYGQTASGKTYTMMGSQDYLGVIPRAIHDIFQKITEFPDREFLLRVSYMEIYNETITDLLCDTRKMKPLIIREDFNRNVYVSDLTEEVVYTSEMALKWITKGEKNRHYGITKMNQRSSRSHTIFRMILESREKGEPSNCEGSVKVSHLNLVDLAGSERAAQTGAEGVRLKEGCNINRSLFILGQVIKKLSDGQVGGFINYRDSKLTRILQNSLGGNAKTRIICTITPVSFDETLTTLQFASTAKYMKNTPYVNEVSSDEALLKRYRKEIMDLKKQLEEVSSETRAQAMEKDQLAQLLEEKDLLQKVQIEKIQNLTQMLVTSSSLTSHQELKAKKKRRVTWCVGKNNKMKDSNFVNEFNMTNIAPKARKSAITVLGEIDESLCSEADVFSNTLDTITETEWNPATTLLSQEMLESELNSLRTNYDSLVLDYEQLRREKEEMELKLKEKNDLDEFEALERKTKKDQEMQLIHEISNLKNLVKHSEVYNQDLENELSSKVELLRDKEDQIKELQKYIDSQKSENIKMDMSYSVENIEELKQMKQTLFDAETVTLDAKKESALLRSENLELKEKMKELVNTCKQMENDSQVFRSQLEAKKKMQVDLEKELQYAFNEITKLTSLIDGKVPKDLLCNLELERRTTDLQKELNKEVEENIALRKELNLLSELNSEVEMLRKEIHDKSEEFNILTSEKDKLFSEVADKECIIQGLLEEIGKTKDDLATTQLNYKSIDQEFQDFKNHHMDFEEKYHLALEENTKLNQEIGTLSKEAQKLDLSLNDVKIELSHKTQELQQKTTEGQERINEMEVLKEELENRNSRLQTVEKEKTLITEKLQQTLEEVRTLTQEKDDLKQVQENLQIERDQLKSDIQDTIHLNIDTQEQLRNALESLKQHQETINTLKMKISEVTCKNLPVEGNIGESMVEIQVKGVSFGTDTKQNSKTKDSQILIADVGDNELIEQQKMFSLMQEKNELQQMLEIITLEKEQLKTDLKENIEMTIENQEELRILGNELKKQQEIVAQEKHQTVKKEEELSRTCERLAEAEENLKEKSQQLEEKQQQLLSLREEMSEMQTKINEMENLKTELKNTGLTLEHTEREKLELTQKLQENNEEMKSITKERNDLRKLQELFEREGDLLKGYIREIETTDMETKEELKLVHINLKEYQETIDKLRRNVSEKTAQIEDSQKNVEERSNDELQGKSLGLHVEQESIRNVKEVHEIQETDELDQWEGQFKAKDSTPTSIERETSLIAKLQDSWEEIKSITKERDDLKTIKEALQVEHDQLKEYIKVTLAKIEEAQDKQEKSFNMSEKDNETMKMISEMEQLKEQFNTKIEMEKLKLSEMLQESQNEMKSVAKERDDLKRMQKILQSESDQLKKTIGELTAKHLETEEELKVAHFYLKEQRETIDKLRVNVSERETEMASIYKELETANGESQKKIQELYEKQEQLLTTKEISVTQEKVSELDQTMKHPKAKDSTLQSVEIERLKVADKLQGSEEEIKIIIMERDDLKRVQEALQMERDQLKESISEIVAKIQELQVKEQQLLKVKNDLQENMYQIEQLKKQSETQNSILESIEMEKLKLTQQLHETLDEVRSVTKERDYLRSVEGVLKMERDQLRESLQETEAKVRSLEKQEELKIVHRYLNVQELKANEHQLHQLKEDIGETQNKMCEIERLKKQLKTQSSTLDKLEMENLNLAQKLHENLEENKSVMKERDNLKRVEDTLKLERDQLKENLQKTIARDLETQQELKIARMHLKEYQKTADKFKEKVSEQTAQISNIQKDLNKSKDELQKKIQELQQNEIQRLKLKDVNNTQEKMNELEQLKKQLEAPNLSLHSLEMKNLHLTKKRHVNQEEIRIIAKERDELMRIKGSLKMERSPFGEIIVRDQQNHKEIIKYEKSSLCDGKQKLTETLREKCFRVKELLKKYSEIINCYEFLNTLSLDLEKEIENQKEILIRIKAKLSLPCSQTKQIQKLLAVNQRCSTEFHRVMEKLKYVLSLVTKIKEEHHEAINKFEMDFIDEVEKQNELIIKIQNLQQDCDIPSNEVRDLKLCQLIDLHIEEILKDVSEHDFLSIKTEFQQVIDKRKEMTQVLKEWLNTHFDIEKLQNDIQKENDRMCQVNNFYNNKIIAIMNESTEFEERSAAISKEWEHDLRSMKEESEKMFKNYQTWKASLTSSAIVTCTATKDIKDPHVTSKTTQLTTEKIQELETSLREAKENAKYKESKIIKMQKELEMTHYMIAKLQAKVDESNKTLEKTKEIIHVLQDKVALGAEPYKEEIEDLKTKLVKTDLEKMKTAKEFEKEITLTKATVEYQKDVIRLLKENLRRSQQVQETSMVSENVDSQPLNKVITCGGGSGIVQSTKALILKSEHMKLENEVSKLKQKNEQLIKQQNELLSNNRRLSKEIKTWKERTIKREAHKELTCENSPKSPKLTGTPSKNRQHLPSQCKERNLQDPVPKESPKSWFFDSRSKSLPTSYPVRYFDNSSLGLCPEEHTVGAENVDPEPELPWHTSSGKDVPDCKTQ